MDGLDDSLGTEISQIRVGRENDVAVDVPYLPVPLPSVLEKRTVFVVDIGLDTGVFREMGREVITDGGITQKDDMGIVMFLKSFQDTQGIHRHAIVYILVAG